MSDPFLDWSDPAPPRRAAGAGRGLLIAAVVGAVLVVGLGVVLVPRAVKAFGEDRLTGSCGVVVDGSPSGAAKTGFDVVAQLRQELPAFLSRAGCKTVAFAPIDGSSETSPCAARPVDVDPDVKNGTVNRDSLWARKRAEVLSRAEGVVTCIRTDPRSSAGSDVLGGLKRILRDRPADGTYPVLVVSDFVNNDHNFSLSPTGGTDIRTPQRRTAVLGALQKRDRIPDLADVEVFTAGYGINMHAVPEQFTVFDAFWQELMKERAQCDDFHTP
jgi:hypothetical protein